MLSATMTKKLTNHFHFQDLDKDGFVEQSDWEQCAQNLAAGRGWAADSTEYEAIMKKHIAVWKHFWEPADSDGDGKVTLTEYLQLVDEQQDKGGFKLSLLDELFGVIGEAIDRDGDGQISGDDYRVFFKSWGLDEALADAAFAHLDGNGDGKVSKMIFMQFGVNYFYLDSEDGRENWLFGPLDEEEHPMSSTNLKETKQKFLAESRAALLAQFAGVKDEQWDAPVFIDGERWTVCDILRHLAGAELSMARLIENIRDGGEGASPDFDLNRFNSSRIRKAQDKSAAELLTDLENSRALVLGIMDGLADDDWHKKGRHGSLRILSIAEIIDVIGEHEVNHAADVGRALAATDEAS